MMMDSAPIRTRRNYRKVLTRIELMSAKRGTPEGDRLDVLLTLVEKRLQKKRTI